MGVLLRQKSCNDHTLSSLLQVPRFLHEFTSSHLKNKLRTSGEMLRLVLDYNTPQRNKIQRSVVVNKEGEIFSCGNDPSDRW